MRPSLRPAFLLVLLAGLLAALPVRTASAQEFDCAVSINTSQLSGSDYTFLRDLKDRLEDYVNGRAWTQDRYAEHERINCTIQITFTQAVTLTRFQANLVVAMRRPIYGTTQYSTVVQFNDANWQFDYTQGAALTFDPDRYDPLTTVIDYYAFLLLGYDYDTFAELGGSTHFERAYRIANQAVSLGRDGWSQVGGDQSRHALITQLRDKRFEPLRIAYFDYHFGGLDRFVLDASAAQEEVLGVLEGLQTLTDAVSRAYAIDVFFSAKYGELASIFEDSDYDSEAYALLSQLDSAHLTEYNRLVN